VALSRRRPPEAYLDLNLARRRTCGPYSVAFGTALTFARSRRSAETFVGQWRQPFWSNSVLKPFGARGSVSPWLHHGHGSPAPPQVQACSPCHGRSGWSSQTSRNPHKRRTFIGSPDPAAPAQCIPPRRAWILKCAEQSVLVCCSRHAQLTNRIQAGA
jgi:hypothetical protein